MESLSKNWITEKYVDFELKKYMLLGYLQHVSKHFDAIKLYPHLSELIMHYKNVVELKDNKNALYESFSERLLGADIKEFKLLYEKILHDEPLMKELESIIDFSIPQFEKHMQAGKKVYDFIEAQIKFLPVGIIPLHMSEGYIFLRNGRETEMRVYNYQITIFESADEKYRSIHTTFVSSYHKHFANTYESIKRDIIKQHTEMPNPATYVFESDLNIPLEPTYLPIVKRMLVKHVCSN
ncbi:MAG: hypothetical protein JNK61_00595 [Bacteroidia bacterium]|nr:hypothetical protein [Bacteroidia bacterium]